MAVGALYMFSVPRGYQVRLQSVDEANSGAVPDGIYADNSSVSRVADIPRQYAFRTWNNACIKRSAENCTAVRTGFKRKGEYDKPLFQSRLTTSYFSTATSIRRTLKMR